MVSRYEDSGAYAVIVIVWFRYPFNSIPGALRSARQLAYTDTARRQIQGDNTVTVIQRIPLPVSAELYRVVGAYSPPS